MMNVKVGDVIEHRCTALDCEKLRKAGMITDSIYTKAPICRNPLKQDECPFFKRRNIN